MDSAPNVLRAQVWKIGGNLVLLVFGMLVVYASLSSSRPLAAVQGNAKGIPIAGWQYLLFGLFLCLIALGGLYTVRRNGRA